MMIQYAGSSYWSQDIRLESRGSIAYKLHRTLNNILKTRDWCFTSVYGIIIK